MSTLTPAIESQPRTVEGFHGGPLHTDGFALYIAIGPEGESLASAYAEGRTSDPDIQRITYRSEHPLVVESGAQVRALWETSGALGVGEVFHSHSEPCSQRALADWAKQQGYDAILVLPGAFQDDEGYEWAGGTFGEPQAIVLEPARVMARPR